MLGMWCAEFGQQVDAFWRASPHEWTAIYDVWLDTQARDYLTTGTVAAAVLNANSAKKGKAYGPHDVFPHLKALQPVPTAEELAAKVKAAFGYRKGADKG